MFDPVKFLGKNVARAVEIKEITEFSFYVIMEN